MDFIAWRYPPTIIEDALNAYLPETANGETAPDEGLTRLHEAMRYAVLGGGKRLRSRLLLEAAGLVGGRRYTVANAVPAACALELIHAYSLVHDDLPAMDDAATRRGRAACHRQFDEATAILAGDGLLTLAFDVMAHPGPGQADFDARRALQAIALIARAAGEAGMVAGQAIDIHWSEESRANGRPITAEQLLAMHALKTGALIRASAEAGALLGGGDEEQVAALRCYGLHLGRAFQIHDDLLDIEGDPAMTGKAATDIANNKITAPAVLGLEAARHLALQASEDAVAALASFGSEADTLCQLARFVVSRER